LTLTLWETGTYPEIMECYPNGKFYEHFFDTGEMKEYEDREKAVKFLKKHRDWQIYTEIEGTDEKLYYDRGFHICNRTDWYCLVKDSRYKVMNYTGLDD